MINYYIVIQEYEDGIWDDFMTLQVNDMYCATKKQRSQIRAITDIYGRWEEQIRIIKRKEIVPDSNATTIEQVESGNAATIEQGETLKANLPKCWRKTIQEYTGFTITYISNIVLGKQPANTKSANRILQVAAALSEKNLKEQEEFNSKISEF